MKVYMAVEKSLGWAEQVFSLFRLLHQKLSIREIFILGLGQIQLMPLFYY
jgi:hypothetical protein